MNVLSVMAGFLLLVVPQDDLTDSKIGDPPVHRPAGSDLFVHVSPRFDRAISSFHLRGAETFVVEEGAEVVAPLKWLGWREGKSLFLISGKGEGDRRALIVGGQEETSLGDVRDARLLEGGKMLALLQRTEGGDFLVIGEEKSGPFEEFEFLAFSGDGLGYYHRRAGEGRLTLGAREFSAVGKPKQVFVSGDGKRLAWTESGPDRVVREGEKVGEGVVYNGVHFSPDGDQVTYVTREGTEGYRGWIDDKEIRADHPVTAVRVLPDGTPFWFEAWKEEIGGKMEARGRVVVDGDRDERVLPRPVFQVERNGDGYLGVSRGVERSVLVRVSATGDVSFEEIPGMVGRVLTTSDGRYVLTVQGRDGMTVIREGKRSGPYEKVELFDLPHSKRFGWVGQRGGKVTVVAGEKSVAVALSEFFPPVKISETEMTAAVVGIHAPKRKPEIWVRAVPLE